MAQQQRLQLELPTSQADFPRGGDSAAPGAPGPQHSLQLDDVALGFTLRRSRRGTVAFAVDERGLQVNAPRGMTLPQIEQAIRAGRHGIVGKLAGRDGRSGRLSLPKCWREGVRFPFLGRDIELRLDASRDSAILCDDTLFLPLPPEADERQIKDRSQGWLQGQASRVVDQCLAASARELGMPAPLWQMTFATDTWGGVDGAGRLRLSWRLIHLTPEEIRCVLIRQLVPLRQRAEARGLWDGDAAPVSA
jgi:predicted metal-dependent hydrolase